MLLKNSSKGPSHFLADMRCASQPVHIACRTNRTYIPKIGYKVGENITVYDKNVYDWDKIHHINVQHVRAITYSDPWGFGHRSLCSQATMNYVHWLEYRTIFRVKRCQLNLSEATGEYEDICLDSMDSPFNGHRPAHVFRWPGMRAKYGLQW